MEKACETCVHKDKSAFSATCVECGIAMMNYEHMPLTNADRIRNMSDEQFAHWLVERVTDSPWCKPDAPVDQETKRCQIWDCEKCALEWLRQEAEPCTK